MSFWRRWKKGWTVWKADWKNRKENKREGEREMKKGIMIGILGIAALSCTNAKLVQYNSDRIENMESYLKANTFVKKSDNLEKLREQGQIEFTQEYKSLEREAEAWEEGQ